MDRTIPYFRDVIVPTSIKKGKRVMISTSENAIRGLLTHLCDISPERIHEVNIPTAVPLLYDPERKCIRLLDDELGDPLNRYNFGKSPELIFKPQIYANAVHRT
jgi:2,3-bisphosphoglycerate-dependent phosphoglycerate mutase